MIAFLPLYSGPSWSVNSVQTFSLLGAARYAFWISHDKSSISLRAAKRKKSLTVSLLTTDANVSSFVVSVMFPLATNLALRVRSILMSKTKYYVSTNSYPGGTLASSPSINSNAGKTLRISFSIAFFQKSVSVLLSISNACATLFGSFRPYLCEVDQYLDLIFFKIRSLFLRMKGTHQRNAGSCVKLLRTA